MMEITTVKEDAQNGNDLQKDDLGDDSFTFEYIGSKLESIKEIKENLLKW